MIEIVSQEALAWLLTDLRFRERYVQSGEGWGLDTDALVDMAERTAHKRVTQIGQLLPYTTKILNALGVFEDLGRQYLQEGPSSPDANNCYRITADAFNFSRFLLEQVGSLPREINFIHDLIKFEETRLRIATQSGRISTSRLQFVPEYPQLHVYASVAAFSFPVLSIIQNEAIQSAPQSLTAAPQCILFVRNPVRASVDFYEISEHAFTILRNCNGSIRSLELCPAEADMAVLRHCAANGLLAQSE